MSRLDKGKQPATVEQPAFNPEGRDFEPREFVRVATTLSDMVKVADRDIESRTSSNGEDDDVLRRAADPHEEKPLLGGLPRDATKYQYERGEYLARRLVADLGLAMRLLDKYLLPSGKRRDDVVPTRRFYQSMDVDMACILALVHAYHTAHGPLTGVGPIQREKAEGLLSVLARRVAHCRAAWVLELGKSPQDSPEPAPRPSTAQPAPVSAAAHLQHLGVPQRPGSAAGGSAKSSVSARLKSKLKDKFKRARRVLKFRGHGEKRSSDNKPIHNAPVEEVHEERSLSSSGSSSSSSSSSEEAGEAGDAGESSWQLPELPENTAFDGLTEEVLGFADGANVAIDNIDSVSGFLGAVTDIVTGFLSIFAE